MQGFEVKVNDKIDINVDDRIYKSLIIDIDDDNLKINVPTSEGEYLLVDSGETLDINMYCMNGKCYSFKGDIISKGIEGNISYYKISAPYDIKKIQRRNYFRVHLLNSAFYKNITDIEEDDYDLIEYKHAIIVDLSGGGMKLKVNEDLKKHDILQVKIKLKKIDFLVKCEVVRAEINELNEKICGIRFIDIKEKQEDMIIQELFEIMRKQRSLSK